MGSIGYMMKEGIFDKSQLKDWILANLADSNYMNMRKNRPQMIQDCERRIKFRDHEKSHFGDPKVFTYWSYNEDMRYENDHYVQYYENFHPYGPVKAVLSGDQVEIFNN